MIPHSPPPGDPAHAYCYAIHSDEQGQTVYSVYLKRDLTTPIQTLPTLELALGCLTYLGMQDEADWTDPSQQNLLQQRLIKIYGLMQQAKELRSRLDNAIAALNDAVQDSVFPDSGVVIVPELQEKGIIAKFSDGSLDFVPIKEKHHA